MSAFTAEGHAASRADYLRRVTAWSDSIARSRVSSGATSRVRETNRHKRRAQRVLLKRAAALEAKRKR